MARRKESGNSKRGNSGGPFAFASRVSESKVRKREETPATLREQGGGLLQLRLGRAAQGQGLGAAFALAFNAFLIYAASSSGQIQIIPSNFLDALLWLMPLFMGAVIGVDALQRKWTPYKGYRSSRHFVLSVAALALSVLGLMLILFEFAGLANTPKWVMYPLSVTTISIGLISMADTWRGWGVRKLMSVLSALALPLLMVVWVGLNIDPAAAAGGLLAMFFYFIMALAALISGSELHIIASSTSTAERQILTASDVKLTQLQSSLRELQKALEFRQKGLDEKEAIIESDRRELDGEVAKAEAHSSELQGLQADLEKKEKELLNFEKKVSGVKAEIDARVEQFKMKEGDLSNVEGGFERARRELAEREAALTERDKELKRVAIEVTAAQRQLESKAREASDLEAKLKREDAALESRQKAFLQREKAIQLKDSELRLKSEQLDATKAPKGTERTREMKDWEHKLLAKEKELGTTEVELKTLEDQLKERYENATNIEKRAADERKHLEAKERELMTREKMISDKESAIEKASTEAERLKSAVKEGTARLKEKESEYAELLKSTKVQQASASSTEDALKRKEEELQRRQYQLTKEMDAKEQSLRAQIQSGVTGGIEEVTIEEKKERVRSGTPRLDDLLYGGIPFNSNLLFVGPPYVGKEVVILNFVAEGLKKGVPAIIITTSKPPVEIAKEMAPILPTFVEYEQLGLVHWIDCSGSTAAAGKPTKEKNVFRVDGPTDFNGIMKVVNELDHEFKGKYPYFRLAFMTLSSCIGPDQGAAMNFVQKLVNRLRQTKAVAAYALERGMHTDQQVESLEHLLDGAIQFKSDKQKTMLQVVGLGESQTRDWVPYKHTNKAIMIGSFQLERIR